jgi:L-ornithine N5-oxygenase
LKRQELSTFPILLPFPEIQQPNLAPSAVNVEEESNGAKLTCQPNVLDGHTNSDKILNLICIGFGPASLAIGIALSETVVTSQTLFLEKQPQFGWHSGMQLPTAKMQISFLKDLVTPRNPKSHFTFLNYLFSNGRLNNFINLGTFLPSRVEYEDYLRWCAGHFERQNQVRYGVEVLKVKAGNRNSDGKVDLWAVLSRENGKVVERQAKHVVIAVGGKPVIPETLRGLKHVAHSSNYSERIRTIQENEQGKRLRFAVVGSGQSAAEIFNDLWERFPEASVNLIIKGPSLRPSDDSPL